MSTSQLFDSQLQSPSLFEFDEMEDSDGSSLSYQNRSNADQNGLPVHLGNSESHATHAPYAVEWKLTANNRMITKDSEQNILISPDEFWTTCLRAKLRDVLDRKLPSTKTFQAVDTDVVVSVTDRSQRDLVKRFDELDINWSVIEAQLQTWSHLTRMGKSLRVDLSFNYVQTRLPNGKSATRRPARGRPSVSDEMLSDRDLQISAERSSTGVSPVWPDVYNLMRCTGPPCRAGPYCWRDTTTSKHYKLKTHHLRTLVEHVEEGGELRCHDDVPELLRRQLYAEEQQHRKRQRRRPTLSAARNLTDHSDISVSELPQLPLLSPSASTSATSTSTSLRNVLLDIPGLRDDAIRKYSDWQCSQVRDEDLKMDFRKACDLALKEGLDLELMHKDPDTGVFIQGGVRRGIAVRFVSDVENWVKFYSHD